MHNAVNHKGSVPILDRAEGRCAAEGERPLDKRVRPRAGPESSVENRPPNKGANDETLKPLIYPILDYRGRLAGAEKGPKSHGANACIR
jgi:hypothetical protein